jgi:hypothetical protein
VAFCFHASVDFNETRRYPFDLMSPLHRTRFLRVLALLAVLLFAGDMMADSVGDLCQASCPLDMSQSAPCPEQAPCHCSCAGHIGAVIAVDFAMPLDGEFQPACFLEGRSEALPPRLAASIDHPPQLS